MGWATCGDDSKGRPIGYAIEAICDEPGCKIEIDRGLFYACGGMHGEDEHSCEGYFCEDHRTYTDEKPLPSERYVHSDEYGDWTPRCNACTQHLDEHRRTERGNTLARGLTLLVRRVLADPSAVVHWRNGVYQVERDGCETVAFVTGEEVVAWTEEGR